MSQRVVVSMVRHNEEIKWVVKFANQYLLKDKIEFDFSFLCENCCFDSIEEATDFYFTNYRPKINSMIENNPQECGIQGYYTYSEEGKIQRNLF